MVKIVYNATYGGFSLSDAGMMRYAALKGMKLWPEQDSTNEFFPTWWTVPPSEREGIIGRKSVISRREFARDDPVLVQVVEELGAAANGSAAWLAIVELAPGTYYRITEYDGRETVELRDEIKWNVARNKESEAK